MPETLYTPSSRTDSMVNTPVGPGSSSSPVSASDPHTAGLAEELNSCLPLFPILATQLREAVHQIEQGVVQVGESFDGMAQRAREAVAQISPGASGADSDGTCAGISQLIANTRETMGRLLQRIEQTCELSGATVQRMLQIEQQIHGLNSTLKEIDSVASNARLLALNGQIEAARAGKHGAAFAIVATETAKMAVHAVGASKTIRTMINALAKEIGMASQDLRERASADAEEAAQSRTEVTHALDCMATLHEGMQETILVARDNSQRLARDISQAVVAMQFQDAVSQRVGHVINTLEEIHGTLQSKLDPNGTEPCSHAEQDWARRMAQQYTMASEHNALAAHVAVAADDAQDLGNNVELF